MEPKSMIQLLQSLNAGNNTMCQACRVDNPDIANALGPWFSCDPANHGDCIAFVGKIARGDDLGALVSDKLEDVSPKAVVFYAGTGNDEYIHAIQPRAAVRYVNEVNTRILIGKKQLPWWSRKYFAGDGSVLTSFLRIGHPERMKKEPYVEGDSRRIEESLNSHVSNKAVNWMP